MEWEEESLPEGGVKTERLEEWIQGLMAGGREIGDGDSEMEGSWDIKA